jgi:hypothetical protein
MSKPDMRPFQAADILAHCALTAHDRFSQIVLDRLSENCGVQHEVLEWTAAHIEGLQEWIANDEEERSWHKRSLHGMRRFLGNFGIKVSSVPGGIEIDSRNAHEITQDDIRRILENDPSLECLPAKEPAD